MFGKRGELAVKEVLAAEALTSCLGLKLAGSFCSTTFMHLPMTHEWGEDAPG